MKIAMFVCALALAACASSNPAPIARGGGGTVTMQWRASIPTIAGNNATIILFDTTGGNTASRQGYRHVDRIVFTGRCDQAITLNYQILHTGSTTWRTMNGGGSGVAVAANTDTVVDFLALGPDSRVTAVTGGTGPSACEYDIGLFTDRTLGL
jgi:hypothetical protein